jgi:hypothetical protein
MKLDHSCGVKAMPDEQLDAALDALREMLAARAGEAQRDWGKCGACGAPAPKAQSPEATPEPTQKHKSNRLMREADTAVGPRERKSRRRKVPSPASTFHIPGC